MPIINYGSEICVTANYDLTEKFNLISEANLPLIFLKQVLGMKYMHDIC